jgi:signal transduction histidine kinase/ActR/RegA family two-component response regulator
MRNILLIDAGAKLAEAAHHIEAGARIDVAEHCEACMHALSLRQPDLIIWERRRVDDPSENNADLFSVLKNLRGQCGPAPILAVLDPADEKLAGAAVEAGATDFLTLTDHLHVTLPLAARRMFALAEAEAGWRCLKEQMGILQTTQARKKEFLALVMHDLRAPLQTLRIYAQFLVTGRLGNLSSAQKEKVELILRSADRLAHSVDSIHRYERLESPNLELVRMDFDLKSLFMDVISAVSRPCMEKGITLVQSFPPGAARVHADRELIFECLKELVENAVAHTSDRGSITLAITEGDGEYAVSVTDSGCGIKAELLPRIFESAWLHDAVAGRAGPGMGLGLAIVKRVMDLHGFQIDITSELGRGTRVRFRLPHSNSIAGMRGDPGSAVTRVDQFKRVVLVVDDDQDNLASARSVLEFAGYTVLGANGCDEAREQLAVEKVDAVLLDYAMAGVNGLEVLQRLKQHPATSDVPVIMLSGCSDDKARAAALRMGAAGFIVKPFMPALLLKELSVAISAASGPMPISV